MKICRICNKEKSIEEFHKCPRGKLGVDTRCKICKNLESKNRRAAGSDVEYWKNPTVKARKKEWNEKDYQNNKQRYKDRTTQWIENNHERHRKYQTAYSASYRAYKKRATPDWTSMEELFNFYKNCPSNMEVDHIIPLNHPDVCGLHVRCNFQYLSRSENAIKNNQWDGTYDNESWRRDLKKEIK